MKKYKIALIVRLLEKCHNCKFRFIRVQKVAYDLNTNSINTQQVAIVPEECELYKCIIQYYPEREAIIFGYNNYNRRVDVELEQLSILEVYNKYGYVKDFTDVKDIGNFEVHEGMFVQLCEHIGIPEHIVNTVIA